LLGAVLSLNLQDTPNVFAEQLGWGRNARICVASLRRHQLTQRNEPAMKMIREQKLFHHEGVSAILSLLPFGPQRSSVEPLDLFAIWVQDCAGSRGTASKPGCSRAGNQYECSAS
jgi:hypothetical protein